MNATKENAATLLGLVDRAAELSQGIPGFFQDLKAFLLACRSRLPSAEAVERDRERRKKPKLKHDTMAVIRRKGAK